MIPNEYRPMVDKLKERTALRTISWKPTSDSAKFSVEIGLNTITIDLYTPYAEPSEMIAFEILDTFGERIDGFYIPEHDDDYSTLNDLYSIARRNALKIDQTISNIMNILNEPV